MNEPLRHLLVSGVSMRRAARLLRIHRITVARKLRFLAHQARVHQSAFRATLSQLTEFQFDDLETFEHSKCKPISVTLAVLPSTRTIVGFEVSSMPAKGLLARKARKKYGYRYDGRGPALHRLFRQLSPHFLPQVVIRSDENPRYPAYIRTHFPTAKHISLKGQRGSLTGGGELKKIRFDPLFSLNHTCAMFRANVNRLFRRTWCTTKKRTALRDHLDLYADYHNRVLTPPVPMMSLS